MTFTMFIISVRTIPWELTYIILVDHEDSGESSDELSTTGINLISTLALVHSELEHFSRNITARNPDISDYQNPITGSSIRTFSMAGNTGNSTHQTTSARPSYGINAPTQLQNFTALGPHNPPDTQTRSQISNVTRSNQVRQTTTGTCDLTGISIYLSTFKLQLNYKCGNFPLSNP